VTAKWKDAPAYRRDAAHPVSVPVARVVPARADDAPVNASGRPRSPSGAARQRDYELGAAKTEYAQLSDALKEMAVRLTLVEEKECRAKDALENLRAVKLLVLLVPCART